MDSELSLEMLPERDDIQDTIPSSDGFDPIEAVEATIENMRKQKIKNRITAVEELRQKSLDNPDSRWHEKRAYLSAIAIGKTVKYESRFRDI